MKKCCELSCFARRRWKKITRVMKLTITLLLFAILTATAGSTYSQSTRINLKMRDASLVDVFREIERTSEFGFFFKSEELDLNKHVSIDLKNATIDEILEKILIDNYSYRILDKNIIITRSSGNNTIQQQKTVSGKVTDSSGGSLPGVSVVVKGTTTGNITDVNGNYSLSNVPENATLQFSFVGMKTLEVAASGKSMINVSLLEESIGIEEVVAVGYGTQKKVNLTGSISSVSTKELESRPITQASQALAGLATGVSVSQGSGAPGGDGAEIRIRGIGTFSDAGKDPLILIDGLAAGINDVDPSNIKSISVLKDAASAAIYGTRAANGVILIETKRGEKGKLQISYNNYFGWQKVTELPEFLDSWEYATYKNVAVPNSYTEAEIAKYKDGSDPDNYPNVPHLKNLLNSGSGFQTNHNVNFTGGDGKNSYLISLGYLSQDGIVAKNNFSKYNFGLNFDSQLRDNIKLKINLNGYSKNTDEPRSTGDMQNMIGFAVREAPIYAGRKSDGTYGYQDDYAPEAWMDSESFTNKKGKNFLGGMELSWELIKGLTLSGKAGYKYYNYTDQWFQSTFVFDESKTVSPNKLSVTSGDNSLLTLQSLLQYTKSIEKHNLSALAGFSQEEYREDWTTAFRDNFPNNSLYELNAGSASNMQNSGSGAEWALRSYFGRVNYDFNGKYLFEANARYDGTSRFPSSGRWGLFPSVSAGWRMSEESFIKDNLSWINNLKLRASWGKLGNQNIGNYPYQNVLATGQNYTFGGTLVSGIALTTLSNADVTWETTTVADLGFDLSMLKDKLSVTFDYFDKTTSDILYKKSVSSVLGLSVNEYNAGEVKNKGFEVVLNYRTSIGKVNIGVAPNFSYVNNKVTKLAEGKQEDISQGLFVGEPIGAIYGYVADGIFVDAADVASYATQPIAGEPGVIRFKDISGPNGVPDGKVDATYDRKVIGSTTPKYYYGATITADYKGFDLSILLQGLGGFEKQMGSYMAFAFYNSGQIQRWQADGAWTEANPDANALYPKITNLNQGSENVQSSTFWNRNASFLRLKNLQVGYTLPKRIVQKIKLSNLRIFYSGQNLFTINHFYTGWDPEMYQETGDQPSFYPITSVNTFGINVKF
jgi:TonB-dependent starch-binding outer membrane protein SusC